MCVFCAAIPLTAATGASINRRLNKAAAQADAAPRHRPIGKATAAAIVVLMACSVYYHTHYGL